MPDKPCDSELRLMALDVLTERNKGILIDRMVDKLTYEAIASKHGISRERVRQIVKRSGPKIEREMKRLVSMQQANEQN